MTDSGNKDVARAFYGDLYVDVDQGFDSYVSTDLVNQSMGGIYTREKWLAAEKEFAGAFESLTAEVIDQIGEDDKVATRFEVTAKNQIADYFGAPAAGGSSMLRVTVIDRFEEGKIAEHYAEIDFGGFMQGLAGA
jgi:predicted ester cyclase